MFCVFVTFSHGEVRLKFKWLWYSHRLFRTVVVQLLAPAVPLRWLWNGNKTGTWLLKCIFYDDCDRAIGIYKLLPPQKKPNKQIYSVRQKMKCIYVAQKSAKQISYIFIRGTMTNVVISSLEINQFDFLLYYHFHFQTNTLWKDMNAIKKELPTPVTGSMRH